MRREACCWVEGRRLLLPPLLLLWLLWPLLWLLLREGLAGLHNSRRPHWCPGMLILILLLLLWQWRMLLLL